MTDPVTAPGPAPTPTPAPTQDPYAVVAAPADPYAVVKTEPMKRPSVGEALIGAAKDTLKYATGIDADKSVYENVRHAGPIALTMGAQFLPGFRAMGPLARIATAGAVGAGSEALGQGVDAATGHPQVDNPALRIAAGGAMGAGSEAIPAAVGIGAKKLFTPSQPVVTAAYDAVKAKVGEAMIDPGPLQAKAADIVNYYTQLSKKLPNTGAIPGPVKGYLEDAALGNPLTFDESSALKAGLQEIRNKPGPEGAVAQRLLGVLEKSRVSLAESAGALDEYKMAKTLEMAKEGHETGMTAKIADAAMGPVTAVFGIKGVPAAVAKTTSDAVVERLMANPKYQPQVQQLIEYLNDKSQSSKIGPLITRLVMNVAAERLDPSNQSSQGSIQPPPVY